MDRSTADRRSYFGDVPDEEWIGFGEGYSDLVADLVDRGDIGQRTAQFRDTSAKARRRVERAAPLMHSQARGLVAAGR